MKFLRLFIIVLTAGLIFSSCQKEFSAEAGNARGSLKLNATGDCTPAIIKGTFKKDTILKTTNYADIQVNITQTGTYYVKSDTVNGYSFSAAGAAVVTGTNTIRLLASGKPITPGVDVFTIKFDTSKCEFDVTVTGTGGGGGGGTAVYTLGGSPGACTGATLSGTYMQGSSTTGNTATINVNVTTIGTYNISTAANNVTFSGSGNFTATGPQTIILTASGIPLLSGPTDYILAVGSGSCTFNVPYTAVVPAVYTLSGAPGACTVATVNGAYGVNIVLNSTNTVTVQVDVQSVGSYTIMTNNVNGMSFSKSGFFTATGIQTVILNGMGTPITSGSNTFIVGTPGCTFSFMVLGPASYTFSGAPGACIVANVNGTYQVNNPLTASNSVDVQVNVTAVGSYNISTNGVGGITFSKTGAFNTTGIQTVTLDGNGTPNTAGPNLFTVGSGGCTFPVNVSAPTSPCVGLIAGDFAIAGQFMISGLDFEANLGSEYQVSIQSGFIKMDIFFSGGTRPIPGIYNVGATLQITCPDQNFISNARTWDATGGQIYVSIDASNDMTVEFCNVPFTGTSPLSGPISSTGSGKTVTQ